MNPGLQDFAYAPQAYDAGVAAALAAAIARTDAPGAVAEQINGVTKQGQGEKCMSYADCARLVQEHKDIDYDGVSWPLEFVGVVSQLGRLCGQRVPRRRSLVPLRSERAGRPLTSMDWLTAMLSTMSRWIRGLNRPDCGGRVRCSFR